MRLKSSWTRLSEAHPRETNALQGSKMGFRMLSQPCDFHFFRAVFSLECCEGGRGEEFLPYSITVKKSMC